MTSSVYGKGVKRVQNSLLQAITTMMDLFLLSTGCKAYLNNYILKMKFPLTQEEISYRENLTNRVSAISSTNSLFTDVETKSTRLRMLKTLVATLNYGDDLIACIDDEIKAATELEAKAAEEEANTQASAVNEEGLETLAPAKSKTSTKSSDESNLNLDLSALPNATDTPKESFSPAPTATSLREDTEFLDESDDLPKPSELDDNIDFSRND